MFSNKNILIFSILISTSILLFLILTGTNANTVSDPRGTFLTSQALLENSSVRIDNLLPENYPVYHHNGHLYNYFPLGTALFSTPLYLIYSIFDMDPVLDDKVMQIISYSIYIIISFLFLILTARELNIKKSFIVPIYILLLYITSPAISTNSTGLWSSNMGFLFSTISLFFYSKYLKIFNFKIIAIFAIFIFSAYLCRPTLAIMALSSTILFINKKPHFIFYIFLMIIFLSIFSLWSLYEYNMILPPYYQPGRLNGDFLTGFLGNIFSPSRGVVFFYPVFLIVLFLIINNFFDRKKRAFAIFSLIWTAGHIYSTSTFPHWYLGYSFGARWFVDLVPLCLFTFLINWDNKILSKKFTKGILLIFIIWGIYVNTYTGLYNPWSLYWNGSPDVDRYNNYLWDWEYPQFLANRNGHQYREKEHGIEVNQEWKLAFIDQNHNTLIVNDDICNLGGHIFVETRGTVSRKATQGSIIKHFAGREIVKWEFGHKTCSVLLKDIGITNNSVVEKLLLKLDNVEYFNAAINMPSGTGIRNKDLFHLSWDENQQPGFVIYGPYINLSNGTYKFEITYDGIINENVAFDIACKSPNNTLYKFSYHNLIIQNHKINGNFIIDDKKCKNNVELRVFAKNGAEPFKLKYIFITKS